MHLLFGNLHMESSGYDSAIQSFQDAQIKLANRTRQPPLLVSLVYHQFSRHVSKSILISYRYLAGYLMILRSQFSNSFVKPSLRQVARCRLSGLYYT